MPSIFSGSSKKKTLGIDIGTFAVKVVELSPGAEKSKLENYGEIQSKYLYEKPFRTFEKNVLSLSTKDIAAAITSIIQEAKIRTKDANFSLPDFSSFFTTLQLPPMSGDELARAVRFEARQHVPMPISDMALDWMQVADGEPDAKKKVSHVKVLMVAVPKRVVEQYQEIAQLANLRAKNLEAEVFSLTRAHVKKDNSTGVVAFIDIGAQSTTCSIVDAGILKLSHSFDTSGNNLTKDLADQLSIEPDAAERLKTRYGILPDGKVVADVLKPRVDSIIMEVQRIFQHFHQTESKIVAKVVLTGGAAYLAGAQEYFADKFRKQVEIGDPFVNVAYPQVLEPHLKKIGPSFSVAIGAALGTTL